MKKMRKMVASLLCMTVISMTLTACGGGETSQTKGEAKTETQETANAEETKANEIETKGEEGNAEEESKSETSDVTGKVEFWNDKLALEDPSIIEAISQGAEKASGIAVEVTSYPDVAAYQTSLQQSIKETKAPGLFTWWSGGQLESLVKNGLVEDVTDLWNDYIIPAGVSQNIADAFTIDGKIYAAPYSALYGTIIYNMDSFKTAGAEVPTTFDEFLSVCEKLKTAGITPIAIKNDSWASFIWFQQLVAAFEPQLYSDICSGAKTYTDPDVKKVMEIWKDMFDKGYFDSPVSIDDVRKNIAKGKAAMMLDVNSEIAILNRNFGMVSEQTVSSFVFPSMNGGKNNIFFEASPLCVSSASEDKGSALKALETWYGEDVQTVFTDSLGMANTSGVKATDPTINKIVEFTGDEEKNQLILRFYENTPEEIRNYAIDELSRFMYSGADIDEVLTNIQKKADEVFK